MPHRLIPLRVTHVLLNIQVACPLLNVSRVLKLLFSKSGNAKQLLATCLKLSSQCLPLADKAICTVAEAILKITDSKFLSLRLTCQRTTHQSPPPNT